MLDFRQKTRTVCFSDTLLPSYQSVRYRNPAEHSLASNGYSNVNDSEYEEMQVKHNKIFFIMVL